MKIPLFAYSRTLVALPLFPLILLSACSRKSQLGYEGYVEGKFVFVASSQAGRLDHLSVNRGETIDVSHPLFTLEAEPEASVMRQAEKVLRADEARLADLQTGKRPPEIEAIRAQLEDAKAEWQKSVDLLAIDEHREVGRRHLLLSVVGDLDAVVADRVAADRGLGARLEQHLLIERYLGDPKPVLWRGAFIAKAGESPRETVARCYPNLIAARRQGYAALAHATLEVAELRALPQTAEAFLSKVNAASGGAG